MNAQATPMTCELVRDYMEGTLQSKALKRLPPDWIAAGRNGDSQVLTEVYLLG
jgi:hypothetical protein